MSEPVDPTTTPAWAKLTDLYESLQPDLRGWFAADPSRAKSFTFTASDLYVDLSKNLINADILSALVDLANQVGLVERRDAMFAGEHINVTEDRAVLHTALRAPEGTSLIVDGADVIPEVHKVLAKVYAFAVSAGIAAIGVILGVFFQLTYPDTEISSDLGLLFALVGLVLSWLLRAGWHALRGG